MIAALDVNLASLDIEMALDRPSLRFQRVGEQANPRFLGTKETSPIAWRSSSCSGLSEKPAASMTMKTLFMPYCWAAS
jgi:hypothetical protein